VVTEVYGYSMARKLIWLSLLLQIIYAVLITIAIHLPSPTFWHGEGAYLTVFGSIIRFVFSGTLAALVSSFINIYIVSKLKIPMEGKLFWLRSMFSILIGGLLLVLIVIITGFSGKEIDLYKTWIMLKSTYSMEVLYAFLLVGPAAVFARILKQKEGVDVYDHNTNFNPFALKNLNKA
jgi:queuosine precursor transporter